MEMTALLQRIGLNDKESDMYLTGLEIGRQPASVLAERVGMNRITAYSSLKRMVRQGLATMHKKQHLQYFEMASPHTLLDVITKKEEEWQHLKEQFTTLLPQLPSQERPVRPPLQASSHTGLDGAILVLREALRHEDPVMVLRHTSGDQRSPWREALLRMMERSTTPPLTMITTKGELPLTLVEHLEERGHTIYLEDHMHFPLDGLFYGATCSALIHEQDGMISTLVLDGGAKEYSLRSYFTHLLHPESARKSGVPQVAHV